MSDDSVVEEAACKRVQMKSVSGEARYSGVIVPSGRYELASHSGNVTLYISGDVGFELEAETFSGGIDAKAFSIAVDESDRRNLRGIVGDGSAFIRAASFSGDVRILKR